MERTISNKLVEMQLKHNNNTVDPSETSSHMHDYYEIFFLISGNARFYIESSIYQLKPGDLVIINNKEVHHIEIPNSKSCESIGITFNPNSPVFSDKGFVGVFHRFIDRPAGEYNRISLSKDQTEYLIKLIDKIRFFEQNPIYGSHILEFTTLAELLVFINNAFMNAPSFNSRENISGTLANILDYINNNLEGDLSLSFLEKHFFINRYYLSRIFKKHVGLNLHEYVVFKRITKAKDMLCQGISVLDACRLSGFNDYSHFVRVFKNITKTSPLQYAKINSAKPSPAEITGALSEYKANALSAKKLPDLILTELTWFPLEPEEGDIVTFKTTVKNIGKAATPTGVILGVGIVIDNSVSCWSDKYNLPLAPNESVTLEMNSGDYGVPSWVAKAGTHQVIGFVNDIERIDEITRENNRLYKILEVKNRE